MTADHRRTQDRHAMLLAHCVYLNMKISKQPRGVEQNYRFAPAMTNAR